MTFRPEKDIVESLRGVTANIVIFEEGAYTEMAHIGHRCPIHYHTHLGHHECVELAEATSLTAYERVIAAELERVAPILSDLITNITAPYITVYPKMGHCFKGVFHIGDGDVEQHLDFPDDTGIGLVLSPHGCALYDPDTQDRPAFGETLVQMVRKLHERWEERQRVYPPTYARDQYTNYIIWAVREYERLLQEWHPRVRVGTEQVDHTVSCHFSTISGACMTQAVDAEKHYKWHQYDFQSRRFLDISSVDDPMTDLSPIQNFPGWYANDAPDGMPTVEFDEHKSDDRRVAGDELLDYSSGRIRPGSGFKEIVQFRCYLDCDNVHLEHLHFGHVKLTANLSEKDKENKASLVIYTVHLDGEGAHEVVKKINVHREHQRCLSLFASYLRTQVRHALNHYKYDKGVEALCGRLDALVSEANEESVDPKKKRKTPPRDIDDTKTR